MDSHCIYYIDDCKICPKNKPMNNISKTILESDMKAMEELLDEIIVDEENSEHNVSYYKESYLQRIKSHFRQSQIRLLEVVIGAMKNQQNEVKGCFSHIGGHTCSGCPKILEQELKNWSLIVLEDQISSLNETLEFLKKSL